MVKKQKNDYEKNIVKDAKANPKRFWTYVKNEYRSGIGNLTKSNTET